MTIADLIRYDGSINHDYLLARWHQELVETNELLTTFSEQAAPLGAFMGYFRDKVGLWFAVDNNRITYAVWYEPVMSGVFLSTWCAIDYRRHRTLPLRFESVLDAATQLWPVILCVTRQPHLFPEMQKFGFQYVGEIPGLWDGTTISLLQLTRQAFDQRTALGHARSLANI